MKKLLSLCLIPVFAGCFTTKTPPVSYWPIAYKGSVTSAAAPKYGVMRVLPIVVRAPYGGQGLTVLRGGGSVAFDRLNEFAAPPSQLARNVLTDGLSASGLCKDIVETSSIATSDVSVEVVVDRLALDCRLEGARVAVAEVTLRVLSGHAVMSSVRGSGASDAAGGDFGEAFSSALSAAFAMAFEQLR